MKFNLLSLLLLSFTLFSCSNSSDPLATLSGDATILAFGDSLTFGTGANKDQDYPSRLAKLSNMKVINAGVPGEVSSKGLERLPQLLEQHKPDLLILIHGGNDILRKLSHKNQKNNLLAMIELAKQSNTQIVLFGVPQPGLFLKSAEIYEQLGDETNVPTELTLLPDILGDKSLKADIAHPNAKGYKKMANGIYDFLKEENIL